MHGWFSMRSNNASDCFWHYLRECPVHSKTQAVFWEEARGEEFLVVDDSKEEVPPCLPFVQPGTRRKSWSVPASPIFVGPGLWRSQPLRLSVPLLPLSLSSPSSLSLSCPSDLVPPIGFRFLLSWWGTCLHAEYPLSLDRIPQGKGHLCRCRGRSRTFCAVAATVSAAVPVSLSLPVVVFVNSVDLVSSSFTLL